MWPAPAPTRPDPPRGGVGGRAWLPHSGGFSLVERRKLPPGQLPSPIHWFKWEAAMTWLTGFPLLVLVYYTTRGVYLVDPAVSSITPGAAVLVGIGLLVVSWAGYDLLWTSPLAREGRRAAAVLSWAVLFAVVSALTHVLSGREKGRPADGWLLPVTAALAAVVYLTSPAWLGGTTRGGEPVAFASVKDVIDRRCVSCHSRTPTDDIFRIAPNGVTFDTPESIRARVETIRDRTVVLKNMPLGNKTGMTDAERGLLARWLDQEAR